MAKVYLRTYIENNTCSTCLVTKCNVGAATGESLEAYLARLKKGKEQLENTNPFTDVKPYTEGSLVLSRADFTTVTSSYTEPWLDDEGVDMAIAYVTEGTLSFSEDVLLVYFGGYYGTSSGSAAGGFRDISWSLCGLSTPSSLGQQAVSLTAGETLTYIYTPDESALDAYASSGDASGFIQYPCLWYYTDATKLASDYGKPY